MVRQNTFANVVEEIFQNVMVEARQTSQFKFCLFKFTELTELSLPSIHIYIYNLAWQKKINIDAYFEVQSQL